MGISEIFEALYQINRAYCFGDRDWVKQQVEDINKELAVLSVALVLITIPTNGKKEWVLFSTRTFGCKE